MDSKSSLPLYEEVRRKNSIARAVELVILFLLFCFLAYRFLTLREHGFPWLLAFLCESWFTFTWILTINIKWSQLKYKTYPERLLKWMCDSELPSVDMFVTTADDVLEPPILTVNTVLSLLAADYPSEKLACYVSDDACSPLTFYSLTEASKFALLWVPFCKRYNISVRAPFRYFSGEPTSPTSMELQQDWNKMKDEYQKLCRKIQVASQRPEPCALDGEFEVFSNIERRNHPSIIKIVWENKKGGPNVPHLVYISREKRPKHSHHFKAGAMNVLTRVSGVMTNAPFMLNLDCDMYVNNPQIILHAMCLLFGMKDEKDSGYVQCSQTFYDGLKDDPYGNQLVALQEYMGEGLMGIQGPFYGGTGCFHRRKVIYGSFPPTEGTHEKWGQSGLQKLFGNSLDFAKSAAQTLSGSNMICEANFSNSLEGAFHVTSCGYEYETGWGSKVGWMYGSTTEDVLTGLAIQGRGWKSTYATADTPPFLGCAPNGGPAAMTQQKRWATGLLEVLFKSNGPVFLTVFGKLWFRQGLAYLWICLWGARSVPEICYAILPAYCLITNSRFLPKIHETSFLIPIALLLIYNLYTLWEYHRIGLSTRAWWNNQRMSRVNSMTAWLLGFLTVVLKHLGLSKTVFEITRKDQAAPSEDKCSGSTERFTFDESPIFVPGTTVVLVNLAGLVSLLLFGFQQPAHTHSHDENGSAGLGELLCCFLVLLIFFPFLRGLFGKGQHGIPFATICKSGILAFLFLQVCHSHR